MPLAIFIKPRAEDLEMQRIWRLLKNNPPIYGKTIIHRWYYGGYVHISCAFQCKVESLLNIVSEHDLEIWLKISVKQLKHQNFINFSMEQVMVITNDNEPIA